MYIVRMIEVASRLCDALRGVMLELGAAGIFADNDALPHRKPQAGARALYFMRRIDALQVWLDEMKQDPAICRWTDKRD